MVEEGKWKEIKDIEKDEEEMKEWYKRNEREKKGKKRKILIEWYGGKLV